MPNTSCAARGGIRTNVHATGNPISRETIVTTAETVKVLQKIRR